MYGFIGKIRKNLRAAVDYVINKIGAILIYSNLYPDDERRSYDPQEIHQFFHSKMVLDGKSSLGSGFITYNGESEISDEMASSIVEDYLQMVGIVNSNFIVGKHTDTKKIHWHFCTDKFMDAEWFKDLMKKKSEDEKITVREIDREDRRTRPMKKKACIEAMEYIEYKYKLEKSSVKSTFSRDRYVLKEYSIKARIIRAFEKLMDSANDFNDFLNKINSSVRQELQKFKSRLKRENRVVLHGRVDKILKNLEIKVKSYKEKGNDFLIQAKGFKIKGGTLLEHLSYDRIKQMFKERAADTGGRKGSMQMQLQLAGSVQLNNDQKVENTPSANTLALELRNQAFLLFQRFIELMNSIRIESLKWYEDKKSDSGQSGNDLNGTGVMIESIPERPIAPAHSGANPQLILSPSINMVQENQEQKLPKPSPNTDLNKTVPKKAMKIEDYEKLIQKLFAEADEESRRAEFYDRYESGTTYRNSQRSSKNYNYSDNNDQTESHKRGRGMNM